ncbi:MAG: endopeptidase La [Deltaproteobacteria bacterium]|nr:endopeptidase La [Deltaproteobacteria bacterium]
MQIIQIPDRLPLLPRRREVVFPHMALGIKVDDAREIALLTAAHRERTLVGLINPRQPLSAPPAMDDFYPIGTACLVTMARLDGENRAEFTLEGLTRISYLRLLPGSRPLTALINPLPEADRSADVTLEMLKESCLALLKSCFAAGRPLPEHALGLIDKVGNPGRLADVITIYLHPDFSCRQKVLSLLEPLDRLKFVHHLLHRAKQELDGRAAAAGSGARQRPPQKQKEQLLRQQMKAIQQELGEEDETLEQLRQVFRETAMDEGVRKLALKELDRLERMNPASPDYHLNLNYVEYLAAMPWEKETRDKLDLEHAAKILDEDHLGLEKVKDRILEHLAVCKLKNDLKGPIICLVGPPGVGKTSLGKSIARAMGRQFIRMSLGGMRDEAEIRGHRRTYVGAMPGKIIQELKRAGVRNPVFMLDEVDKLGRDFRGDPAAALLEVMDPEQNHTFTDHYLNVPFDLSRVLFIATANQLDPIPAPLRDRMEIITLPGYSDQEKQGIAFRYLLPRQLRDTGLEAGEVMFTDEAMERIINDYTREAGVRQLEKTIGKILRKLARDKAEKRPPTRAVTDRSLEEYLGPPEHHREAGAVKDRVGIATGLAWTPTGGDILFIEATMMSSRRPNLTLTGSLGEVMKESALTALSCLRSLGEVLSLDTELFASHDLHIHVPAGSIPKDGPSAGLTIFLALLSLFSSRATDHRVAVTGELTLSGRILPVGGIKEKVLAAHRAGIRKVVLPTENLKNLRDIPADVREAMVFTGVDDLAAAIPLVIPGLQPAGGKNGKYQQQNTRPQSQPPS